jgi:hypothetical protein
VDDFFFGVGDFDYRCAAEGADIVRLAAGCGIEGGAVEYHLPAVAFLFAGDNLRLECAEKRIVVVKPLGHGISPQ